MKFLRTYAIVILSFIAAICVVPTIILSFQHSDFKHELKSYKDSVTIQEETIFKLTTDVVMYNIEVENYKDSITLYKDSINSLINELDSVNEELQINKIKIERIREYNRIAAQGNNIKFLRGWINRVIN